MRAHPAMFVRPNGSPEAASGWLRGVSPFLLITTSLLLVPQVYVSPQNVSGSLQRGQLRGQGSLAGLAFLAVVMSPARAPTVRALGPNIWYCTYSSTPGTSESSCSQ